jgi:hypothetical protein
MIHPQEVTKEQLLAAIKSLEERPADRVRILGDLGITAAGVGVGAAAAGTIAGIAGVTSIPVLTTAASWLGASVCKRTGNTPPATGLLVDSYPLNVGGHVCT